MKTIVLASGSSGNSTYVESGESAILIDAGISAKRIKKALSKLGKDISELDGIFVTHEHTDHTYGLERLNRTFEVPIYMNKETEKQVGIRSYTFENDTQLKLKDLTINPISVSHDAANPCGFQIMENGVSLGVFTDLGKANNSVKKVINNASCLVLETNHDIDMLLKGFYPYPIKQRILSEKGHLSNIDAALLIEKHSSNKLKTVFGAHLSKNNNSEDIVRETFDKLVNKKINSIMTKRNDMTELVNI